MKIQKIIIGTAQFEKDMEIYLMKKFKKSFI